MLATLSLLSQRFLEERWGRRHAVLTGRKPVEIVRTLQVVLEGSTLGLSINFGLRPASVVYLFASLDVKVHL